MQKNSWTCTEKVDEEFSFFLFWQIISFYMNLTTLEMTGFRAIGEALDQITYFVSKLWVLLETEMSLTVSFFKFIINFRVIYHWWQKKMSYRPILRRYFGLIFKKYLVTPKLKAFSFDYLRSVPTYNELFFDAWDHHSKEIWLFHKIQFLSQRTKIYNWNFKYHTKIFGQETKMHSCRRQPVETVG